MDLFKSILPPANGILPYYMLIVRINLDLLSSNNYPASFPANINFYL